MAKIEWVNRSQTATVEWMLSIDHKRPSTGSLPPGEKHEQPREDRAEVGFRCLGFTGAVAFTQSGDGDLIAIIGD